FAVPASSARDLMRLAIVAALASTTTLSALSLSAEAQTSAEARSGAPPPGSAAASAPPAPPPASASSPQAPPAIDARAEAREMAVKGDSAFGSGRCDKAIVLWKKAEEKFHAPTILLRIARCEALMGHVVDATQSFESVVRDKLGEGAPPSWIE